MGTYFWRRHRELGDEFRHSLDWQAPDPAGAPPIVPLPNVLTPPDPSPGTPKPL
jgi:hypothetical protein